MLSKRKSERGDKIGVLLIIDKSGSMLPKREETVSEFNRYIEKLKEDKLDYYLTVLFFDSEVKTKIRNTHIDDVGELERHEYVPDGWTALHDAVVKGLRDAKSYDKNICVVITDGEENSSKYHNLTDVRREIDHMKGEHNWEFVFLGNGPDAWRQGRQMGFFWNTAVDYGSRTSTASSYSALYAATNTVGSGGTISANTLKTDDTKPDPTAGSTFIKTTL